VNTPWLYILEFPYSGTSSRIGSDDIGRDSIVCKHHSTHEQLPVATDWVTAFPRPCTGPPRNVAAAAAQAQRRQLFSATDETRMKHGFKNQQRDEAKHRQARHIRGNIRRRMEMELFAEDAAPDGAGRSGGVKSL